MLIDDIGIRPRKRLKTARGYNNNPEKSTSTQSMALMNSVGEGIESERRDAKAHKGRLNAITPLEGWRWGPEGTANAAVEFYRDIRAYTSLPS